MKSTRGLGQRWWYRFIKVLYVGFFALVLLGTNAGIYFGYGGFKTLDYDKTKVTCFTTTTTPPEPFPLSDASSYYFSMSDFSGGTFNYKEFFEGYGNQYGISSVLEQCRRGYPDKQISIRSVDVYALQRATELNRSNLSDEEKATRISDETKKIIAAYGISDKVKYLDFSVKMFDITPAYNYTTTLLYMFGSTLSILLVFELIRRVFYYIVLGTFVPKKSD